MSRIRKVTKRTENPFLNLYDLEATQRNGDAIHYYVASRTRKAENLKAVEHHSRADGVVLFGIYGPEKDRIVLVRQYRYPVDRYVYELPAGLVEKGEDPKEAGIREMYEETGLEFTPVDGGCCERGFYTTVGMTDESCATVYGYCSGTPTNRHQEDTEDIQVVLADRDECRRILREEEVAIMCAYQLMHFIASEGDPLAFLKEV